MTKQFSLANIPAEYRTSTVMGVLETCKTDRSVLPLLADALIDAGLDNSAMLEAVRGGQFQMTKPGDEIVTVARDGAKMAKCGNGITVPIFCTAIYRAVPRKADGVLTWRRVGSYRDSTAGHGITGRMALRAEARAAERGVPCVSGVRHGQHCN